MIKGTHRRMVVVKDTGSDLFEEAYFILKTKGRGKYATEKEFIAEANRLAAGLTEKDDGQNVPRAHRREHSTDFVFGLLAGIVAAAASAAIIYCLFMAQCAGIG